MPKLVLDSTILVSAFLKALPGGASFDLLEQVHAGNCELYLSDDILEETARVLLTSKRIRARYRYPDEAAIRYCQGLAGLAILIAEVPNIRVVRDPTDDKILACAVAAAAEYLVTRDDDLLSLKKYENTLMVSPEALLKMLRETK